MTFVKTGNNWYEADLERQRAFNLRGGYIPFTREEFSKAERLEAENWNELHRKTGYDPLSGKISPDGWISPAGEFYPCRSHEADAMHICRLFYGEADEPSGDRLIQKGWIKVTTSLMGEIYKQKGYYDRMTPSQERTFDKWFEAFIQERNEEERNYRT